MNPCSAPETFSIFTGDQKTMSLKAAYAGPGGDPLDLSACTEIDIALPDADGSYTHLLLSATQVAITSPAILGKFTAVVTSAVSALLNVGELQNIDVTFTIGEPFTVRFFGALSVFERN